MKIWNGRQRTEAWHKDFRSKGIGASESAAVLGMSRYSTPLKVWQEKTGRAFPTFVNADMQRGIDLEDAAREEFNMSTGREFLPCCAEHKDFPEIKASFDGVTKDEKEFVELKCPRTPKLRETLNTHDVSLVISNFFEMYCQVQHQYLVNDKAEKGFLASYDNGLLAYLYIPRDDPFIKSTLTPKLIDFWREFVMMDKEPPLSDGDYAYLDDADAIREAEAWVALNKELKELQECEKALRAALIERGDDGNFIIFNLIRATRVSRETINYKQACLDAKLDLSRYKKESIGFYKFSKL